MIEKRELSGDISTVSDVYCQRRDEIRHFMRKFAISNFWTMIDPRWPEAIKAMKRHLPGYIQEEISLIAQHLSERRPPFPINLIGWEKALWMAGMFDDFLRITRDMNGISLACTSGVTFDDNGNIIIGRVLDYFGIVELMREHTRRYATCYDDQVSLNSNVTWGFPGYRGVVTGYNEQGLFVAVHVSFSPHQSFDGMPSGFLVRWLLEHPEIFTIDDVEEALNSRPCVSSINLLVADTVFDQAAVFEIDNRQVIRRDPEAFGLVITNHSLGRASEFSLSRYHYLKERLKYRDPAGQAEGLLGHLSYYPISNPGSVYRLGYDRDSWYEQVCGESNCWGNGQYRRYETTLPSFLTSPLVA